MSSIRNAFCTKRREAWESGQQVRVEAILEQLPVLKSDPQVVAEYFGDEEEATT